MAQPGASSAKRGGSPADRGRPDGAAQLRRRLRAWRLGHALLVALVLVLAGPVRFARASPAAATVPDLTAQLLQARDAYEGAPAERRDALLAAMRGVATGRRALLLQEAAADPAGFLRDATLAARRTAFPPAIQDALEEERVVTGRFVWLHGDDAGGRTTDEYTVWAAAARHRVRFAAEPPRVRSDAVVAVRGIGLGPELVAASGAPARGALAVLSLPPPPQASGPQQTIALLVNYADAPAQPYTPAQAAAVLFSGAASADQFYRANSFGKAFLTGDVAGWYTIAPTATPCDLWQIASEADAAATAAGVDLGRYLRKVYVLPPGNGCGAPAGWGTIGGTPSSAWVIASELDVRVFEHELGHNLGVHHANALFCPGKTLDAYPSCTNEEYGDVYDVMGNFWRVSPATFQFNAAHKAALGWIAAAQIRTVTNDGTYTVAAAEAATTQPQVLRIPKADTGEYYYLSFRAARGLDGALPAGLVGGASVHVVDETRVAQTKFLDAHPATADDFADGPLADREAFTDRTNRVSVTQVAHTADSVALRVKVR